MSNILVISDFIEGKAVVASVRYSELLKHISQKNKIFVLNDINLGESKSEYAEVNLKFTTSSSKFTGQISGEVNQRRSIEKLIRNKLMMKLWRSFKYSNILFNYKNRSFYENLDDLIYKNKIDMVFATVPDVYALYIVKYIKKTYPHIPIVTEVRDIINHSIGTGNPRYVYKRAEKILFKYSNGVVVLTESIKKHYMDISKGSNEIRVIKNGYNSDNFIDSKYNENLKGKTHIVISHVGSIYKGRNIKDFIAGLALFNIATGIKVTFNIIGVIDADAYSEINSIKSNECVEINFMGSVSHEKAIGYLKNSDIAAIITHKSGSGYAIPGKTFEYVGACKPIIAISEDIELKEFIEPRYGECAKHSAEDVKEKLIKVLNTQYNFDDRLQYSREKQAEHIMEYLDNIQKRCL